jgi:hypothetical protein
VQRKRSFQAKICLKAAFSLACKIYSFSKAENQLFSCRLYPTGSNVPYKSESPNLSTKIKSLFESQNKKSKSLKVKKSEIMSLGMNYGHFVYRMAYRVIGSYF